MTKTSVITEDTEDRAGSIVNAERKAFGIHPGILLTIMREQAGSVEKALVELVMNSVDAGATRIDITTNPQGFSIVDDGKGFTTRDQLESFFDIFGTPHEKGDAYYGKFRVGRGQIMSYAQTVWRSGPFEMLVDIDESEKDIGYDLLVHQDLFAGCRIDGIFKESWYGAQLCNKYEGNDSKFGISWSFRSMIAFLPVPVFVNGHQCNTPAAKDRWDLEDENAWYRFDRTKWGHLRIYNRGVEVMSLPADRFGMSGVVVSKVPLVTNMARNDIIAHKCEAWLSITKVLSDQFSLKLTRVKRLEVQEITKLMNDLLVSDNNIDWQTRERIRKIRFIPDIFGELQSPEAFFAASCYTLFDNRNHMIAERVQSQKLASVVMDSMFNGVEIKLESENDKFQALVALRERLGYRIDNVRSIPFAQYVQELSAIHTILSDQELSEEELLVLTCLRSINSELASACGASTNRSLVAGVADKMLGWTDGIGYIAIHRKCLKNIRDGAATRLVSLMVHEYIHPEPSQGEHAHDHAFFMRCHDVGMTFSYGKLVEKLTRDYVDGICKLGIVPSNETRRHVTKLARLEPKLATRLKAKRVVIANHFCRLDQNAK